MATPHIAGIAALVKQANPDWNAFDVKVALSNTAKILNTTKYDVFAQGAGRVNAYAAAHPECTCLCSRYSSTRRRRRMLKT